MAVACDVYVRQSVRWIERGKMYWRLLRLPSSIQSLVDNATSEYWTVDFRSLGGSRRVLQLVGSEDEVMVARGVNPSIHTWSSGPGDLMGQYCRVLRSGAWVRSLR